MALRLTNSGLLKMVRNSPLGQQVLHQHLIYCLNADIGIERRAAEIKERFEGCLERLVVLVRLLDLFDEAEREVWDALLEIRPPLLQSLRISGSV